MKTDQNYLEGLSEVRVQKNDYKRLLTELVAALDDTYWSSWQGTYKFQNQLDAARESLK